MKLDCIDNRGLDLAKLKSNAASREKMGIFNDRLARAREICQANGLPGLCKAGLLFLISPVYSRKYFYLYEKTLKTNYAPPKMNADKLHFEVVSSNGEAERLEKEGYVFRSSPTNWNCGKTSYTRWLDEGVIAFCTFVGGELGAIIWVIPSEEIQKRITLPIKIDYSAGQAFPRGAWVNPKYRGLGLMRYTIHNRDSYLKSIGVTLTRGTIEYSNKTGEGMVDALGSKKYGNARMTRVLFWKFWKETYEF